MWFDHGWRDLFQIGGAQVHVKKLQKILVVWIGHCDVTSIGIWRHYIHTIWRSKLHYFRQNNTTMITYRWTTWTSNRLLQGRPRSSASLAGLWSRYSNFRLQRQLLASNFFGSVSNILRFLAQAPEQLGPKPEETWYYLHNSLEREPKYQAPAPSSKIVWAPAPAPQPGHSGSSYDLFWLTE